MLHIRSMACLGIPSARHRVTLQIVLGHVGAPAARFARRGLLRPAERFGRQALGPPAVTGEAEAIRLLAASVWGRMRRAFLGVFSSRGCLHTGFWAKGRRHGPHPVKNERLLRRWGLRIRTLSAVLCARSHTRGLRDAEFSGICTPPPGVPAGKKQPPRRNMQSAGRFMQKCGCGTLQLATA